MERTTDEQSHAGHRQKANFLGRQGLYPPWGLGLDVPEEHPNHSHEQALQLVRAPFVNPLTLAELRLRHAQLEERAERLEAQWRRMRATAAAVDLGKEVKALQSRAADYAAIIRVAEGMS